MTPQLAISAKNLAVFYPAAARIRKNYKRGYWGLSDVSFEINRGEILGVIGSNGAGKSTLLSVVSKILHPDRGSINTYGLSVMLFSLNAGMSPYLTGRKNIFLTGLTLGLPKAFIEKRIEEIISFADIGEFIDLPTNAYSTGMKARLGFSIALFLEPEIFLIDEALGVGDKEFRKKSSEALQKKLASQTTALIVSHSEKTIKELCHKAILIEKGRSIAFGTPQEVFKIYNAPTPTHHTTGPAVSRKSPNDLQI